MERSPTCISPLFFFPFKTEQNCKQIKQPTRKLTLNTYSHHTYPSECLHKKLKEAMLHVVRHYFCGTQQHQGLSIEGAFRTASDHSTSLFLVPRGSRAFNPPLLRHGFSGIFSKFLKLLVEIASNHCVISLRCSHGNWNRCVICNHLAVFKSPCVRMSQHNFAFSSAPSNKVEQLAEIFARA